APSEVLRLDNFLIYWVFYTTKANFLQFDLDKYKRFWRFYTISKAWQSKMSESRAVKVAILDKFRQIFSGFIPEALEKNERECGAAGKIRPRIGREGAADRLERVDPGRGSGEKERPTASSVSFRPRIASEGAADLPERVVHGRAL
ncbi:MAG: hypothetical protein II789_03095, partial [Clostridia bacterium]|nr:hypothetical protein [Clostridia bacterium]